MIYIFWRTLHILLRNKWEFLFGFPLCVFLGWKEIIVFRQDGSLKPWMSSMCVSYSHLYLRCSMCKDCSRHWKISDEWNRHSPYSQEALLVETDFNQITTQMSVSLHNEVKKEARFCRSIGTWCRSVCPRRLSWSSHTCRDMKGWERPTSMKVGGVGY